MGGLSGEDATPVTPVDSVITLTGDQIAALLDTAIGTDWRTGGTGTPYTLPASTSSTRGGVLAVTNSIIDTGTSTGIFGWAISHVKRAINAIVPEWARDGNGLRIPAEKLPPVVSETEAAAKGIEPRSWPPLRVHTAIESSVHDWARDATQIPANKLDNAPSASGGTSVEVKHMGGLSASGVTGEQFLAVFPALTLTEGQQVVCHGQRDHISPGSGGGGKIDIFRGSTHAVTAQSSEFISRGRRLQPTGKLRLSEPIPPALAIMCIKSA